MVEHAERRAVRVALLPLQFLRQEIDGRVGLWLMIQLGSRGTGYLLRQDKNMSAKVHLSVSHQHPGWLKPLQNTNRPQRELWEVTAQTSTCSQNTCMHV